MSHPDALQLQAYLDGELAAAEAQRMSEHLARCAPCAQSAEEWRTLHHILAQNKPDAALFSAEGTFWARLAGRLPRSRPATWSAVGYLPPFLLGALGTLLDGLVSLVLAAYVLMGLGIIPSVGAKAASWLRTLLSCEFAQVIYGGLGWSSGEIVERVTRWWGALARSQQESLLAGVILLGLEPLWAAVVLLYLSWAACWSRAERWEHEGGR